MRNTRPSVLFVTDLYYEAKGRAYYAEDLYLTGQLKDDFNILICHPLHTEPFERMVDLVVIRNSGPVIYYKAYFDAFMKRVLAENIPSYNTLTGKGDMAGKDYLVTLTRAGRSVIPTVDSLDDLHRLPEAVYYIVKPKEGADSIGLQQSSLPELKALNPEGMLIQPFIDFAYEVSFYFIDDRFQYALYAPDKRKRWKLELYTPTAEDLRFAQSFIEWNTVKHGIQRVDACRTSAGNLLLVELEDLNPFLSLEALEAETRASFIENFRRSLKKVIRKRSSGKSV